MSAGLLFLALIGLAGAAYALGRRRAIASSGGDTRTLHSLPRYYGAFVAITSAGPGIILLALWAIVQPIVLSSTTRHMIPAAAYQNAGELSLIMGKVATVADGLSRLERESGADVSEISAPGLRERLAGLSIAVAGDVDDVTLDAAKTMHDRAKTAGLIRAALITILAVAGLIWSLRQISADFRARNVVEYFIRILLISAALLAILTTIGIVMSLLFNTIEFFTLYPAMDFFTGMTWSPSFGGGSELGIVPLFWGTLYISIIALIVAVPIGLFAAIYLSEYASPAVRAFTKPMLEVLAGIPTIVYGLFALLTVGPLLLSVFGQEGLGWMQGGTAVMTAGLVMGIMLIPFVSSLSDDIINAVPQSLRDGSLGLGATQSETIRKVVLPAALPGIVGAILLAASRAIGETMIVVLGAGAAAKFSLNPFDAMTTVTAKIVSQLTGDADFRSPEALVAFALGMTLFTVTLALNVFALWIVRKYREQYE